MYKQVKPGFTNYQPQPKYSWALSKMKVEKGKEESNQVDIMLAKSKDV